MAKAIFGVANIQKRRITVTRKSRQKTIKYAHKVFEPPHAYNRRIFVQGRWLKFLKKVREYKRKMSKKILLARQA